MASSQLFPATLTLNPSFYHMSPSPAATYLFAATLLIILKIVVFVLGYKTIKLGHSLITAGIKGEFTFKSELPGFKADLRSLSPGLLFVTLGVLLMIFAIYTDKELQVKAWDPIIQKDTTFPPAFNDSTVTPSIHDFDLEQQPR